MRCPNCGKEIANDSQFCEYCGTKVIQEQMIMSKTSNSSSYSMSPKTNMTMEEVARLSVAELNRELANGARFVQFSYTISFVVMTIKRYSKVFFIRDNGNMSDVRWKYTLINIFLGWWGIPFGPIYTIWSFIENAKGKDVTNEIIAALNNK